MTSTRFEITRERAELCIFSPLYRFIYAGDNFGPAGTPIDLATYGPNGTGIVSSVCSLVIPHKQIWCNTSVGAGAGLSWILTIGGQQSVAPSTAYGVPVISGLGGTVYDAPTQGGAFVTIYGTFLSVQQYLSVVTYGPSGIEHTASGCYVSTPQTAITCTMAAGTGRVLRWRVSVGGQPSLLSLVNSSYAAPSLWSLTPNHCPTSGCSPVADAPQLVSGMYRR